MGTRGLSRRLRAVLEGGSHADKELPDLGLGGRPWNLGPILCLQSTGVPRQAGGGSEEPTVGWALPSPTLMELTMTGGPRTGPECYSDPRPRLTRLKHSSAKNAASLLIETHAPEPTSVLLKVLSKKLRACV